MSKKEILEYIKAVVQEKRSPSSMFIEGYFIHISDFKKLLEMLEEPKNRIPIL